MSLELPIDPYAPPPTLDALAGLPPPVVDGLAGAYDLPPPDLAGYMPPEQGGIRMVPPAPPPPDVALPLTGNPWVSPPADITPPLGGPTVDALALPGPGGPQHVQDVPGVSVRMESPPPPAPDALSSAGGMPAADARGHAIDYGAVPFAPTLTPEQHYQQTARAFASHPLDIPDEAEQRRFLSDLAARDPAAFADLKYQHQLAAQKEAAARRAQLAERDWQQQQAHQRMREEAMRRAQAQSQQLLADAQRLADTKTDPTGGLSGGRAIAGALGAIFGGLVQGRTGSARNAGMDALNETIQRGINAQQADLANRRESIGLRRSVLAEEYARSNDAFMAAETVRLAALKHAQDLIETDMQNFDPRGTQALARAELRTQVIGAQQQAVAAVQQKNFDNHLKVQTAAREQQIADETARNNRAQLGLGYARIAEDKAQRIAAKQLHADEKAQERADKEAERLRKFSLSSPRPVIALDKDGKPVAGPNGQPQTTGSQFTNSDGKPWTIEDPDDRRAVKSKIVAASEVADMIDEVLDIRDKVGGESSLWNSDAKQRLDVLQSRLALVRKSGTQGMSSDKDFENLAQSIGAKDLSSFRARSAGLKEARDRTVSELNSEMRAANYTGPAVSFANRWVDAGSTPADEQLKSLLLPPSESLDEATRNEVQRRAFAAGKESGLDYSTPEDRALVDRAAADVRARYRPGASVAQQDQIDQLGILARGPADDKQAAKARTDLQTIAATAQTGDLRRLAQAALESALLAGPGSPEPTSMHTDSASGRIPAAPPPRFTPAPPPIPDELRLP